MVTGERVVLRDTQRTSVINCFIPKLGRGEVSMWIILSSKLYHVLEIPYNKKQVGNLTNFLAREHIGKIIIQ